MRDCCKYWLQNCKPRKPASGQFSEFQSCPSCENQRKVTFEEIPQSLNGKSEYVLIDPWTQEFD